MTAGRALLAVGLALLLGGAACESSDVTFPVRPAPASRHDALRDALTDDARGVSFANGDWLEDQGDAPFYGTAWLARRDADAKLTGDDAARLEQSLARARTLLASDLAAGDAAEKVLAALGLVEHIAASQDQSDVAAVDSFLDRLDAALAAFGDSLEGAPPARWELGIYGPTAATALVALAHAEYALLIGSPRTRDHLNRAVALEQRLTDLALTDLVEPVSGRQVRGYASSAATGALDLLPNVTMLLLEARLYRLTRSDTYLLQARALYGALQPLKLSDTPARYASPGAQGQLNVMNPHVATLASQNYLALALMALFEITGEQSFIDETDRVLDAVEALRGPWCLAQVDGVACTPAACSGGQACVAAACTADRCTTGLLYDITDGVLPTSTSAVLFCSGCSLQTLYVLGVRRQLAGEAF